MLTLDTLKTNITNLTDEQYAAIAVLSKNDENTVIANKTREIHDAYDRDFKEVLGLDKPLSEKSYVFWKSEVRKLKDSKTGDDTLKAEIVTLKADKVTLEKAIKDGKGDDTLKAKIDILSTKITDKENTITKLRSDIKTNEAEYRTSLDKEAFNNVSLRVNSAFANALQGKKFKAGIPQSAIDATINIAKEVVLNKGKAEFIKDDNGNESVIFRDDKGNTITNPEKLHNPFTAGEMLISQLVDIIDGGQKKKGGGSDANGNDDAVILDLSGVTNRVDATDAIRKNLSSQGFAYGSSEFQEEYNKAYADNKVSDLPIKND